MDYFNTSEENESRSWNTREQSLDEVIIFILCSGFYNYLFSFFF